MPTHYCIKMTLSISSAIGVGSVSGKTVFAEITLIENLCKPKTFSAYISPTFSQGRKVYTEITRLLENKNIIKKSNASTLTIETVFNSTLQFFSMESPTAIRGYTVSGVLVMDEAAFFSDELTDGSDPYSSVIMPITKAKKPKVLVISTPKGKRGMFFNLYNKALKEEKGFKLIEATIYDDKLVSEEEIENIKKIVNPLAFQEEFLCQFLDSSLTYFQGFENCFKDYQYNNNINQYIGIDLSATVDGDNTVLTKINKLNQTEQHIIKGTLNDKYNKIAEIINNTPNLRSVYIEENGVGFAMIDSIKKLLRKPSIINNWATTSTSKQEILGRLAIVISDKNIDFNNSNKQLYSELSTFICKYTKKGNLQLEAMKGAKDDTVLSLAIALRAKEEERETLTPNILGIRNKERFV